MSSNHSVRPPAGVELDCRQCGVCCGGRPGTVLVEALDQLRWRQAGREDMLLSLVPGHFSLPALPSDSHGRCLYQGTPASPSDCSVYPIRPQACRDFEAGSPECLAARAAGGRD